MGSDAHMCIYQLHCAVEQFGVSTSYFVARLASPSACVAELLALELLFFRGGCPPREDGSARRAPFNWLMAGAPPEPCEVEEKQPSRSSLTGPRLTWDPRLGAMCPPGRAWISPPPESLRSSPLAAIQLRPSIGPFPWHDRIRPTYESRATRMGQ
jgi:hypothetical protein